MYVKKYLMKVNRQSQWAQWSNQKLLMGNTVQKQDCVIEGLKNYNVFEQTHKLVQERALASP